MPQMRVSVFLTFALLFLASHAARIPHAPVPRGWKRVTRTAARAQRVEQRELTMTLALRRRNVDKLEKLLLEVSDPNHERYGDHLNHVQMRELVSPGSEAVGLVTRWLEANDINEFAVSIHEDSIAFQASPTQVEALLQVKFHLYENGKTKQRVWRALGVMTVPDEVAGAVEVFAGHRGFPLPRKREKRIYRSPLASIWEMNVTPALLYTVYNVSWFPTTPAGQTNIQSIFQAEGESVDPKDLQAFCSALVPSLGTCQIAKYLGRNNASQPGDESSLDVEYLTAMGRGAETWILSYRDHGDFCGDLIRWGHDVLSSSANGSYPYVISMSYGTQVLPTFCFGPTVGRVAEDVMKMGAMGVTVVIGSGDSGSGEATGDYHYGLLAPAMPASIPYCTAVGATTFVSGNNGTEQATQDFGSGGGFSYDYAQPTYQQAAVSAFFARNYKLPPNLSYDGSGRGTPDVATLGDSFWVLCGGQWNYEYGTSASTPTFAGLVTLLNNIRLEVGKTMGFINPFLYQNPQGFTDITMGNNDLNLDGYGWYAVPGWDPVTGLGTPNWGRLAEAVKRLNAKDLAKKATVTK